VVSPHAVRQGGPGRNGVEPDQGRETTPR
jgi:hypothetical protein